LRRTLPKSGGDLGAQVKLNGKISASKLNARLPRTVKAISEHFASHPLKSGEFGHFRPARYFAENLATLAPGISEETKARFEAAFEKINALL
jgi:hypothetical protein